MHLNRSWNAEVEKNFLESILTRRVKLPCFRVRLMIIVPTRAGRGILDNPMGLAGPLNVGITEDHVGAA